MFDLFHRRRRRLILVGLLICLPVSAAILLPVLQNWWGVPWHFLYNERYYLLAFLVALSVIMSTLNAAILLIPALIIVFAPRWRGILEGAALGVCLGLLIIFCVRSLEGVSHVATYSAPLGLGVFLAAVYFRVVDRIMPKLRYAAVTQYMSRKPADQLWMELVPAAEYLDHHWQTSLIQITEDPQDANTYIAHYAVPKATLQQTMYITHNQMPDRFAYRYDNGSTRHGAVAGGTFEIKIKDLDFARQVTLTIRVDKLPFTQWMAHWFGDILGDQADHLIAMETGKKDYSTTGAMMRKAAGRQTGSISPNARVA